MILGDGDGRGSWQCVCLDFVALSKEAGENRLGDAKNVPHRGRVLFSFLLYGSLP